MLRIQWSKRHGWNNPRITPLQNFQMHPGKQLTQSTLDIFKNFPEIEVFEKMSKSCPC